MQVHAQGSSAALYQRLRSRQPVPYRAFLHTQPSRRILSFSPELFFRIESDHGNAPHHHPAHEGNRAARPHQPRRPRPGGVAPQRPQKPQRKRDDRRPAAQRPRPPLQLRHRPRREPLRRRALPHPVADDLDRHRRTSPGRRLPADLPRALSLRLHHRRAQGPRHATAGADRGPTPRRLHRRHRLLLCGANRLQCRHSHLLDRLDGRSAWHHGRRQRHRHRLRSRRRISRMPSESEFLTHSNPSPEHFFTDRNLALAWRISAARAASRPP